MKKTVSKRLLVFISCALLIAAIAVTVSGCKNGKNTSSGQTLVFEDGDKIGEGEKHFDLYITNEKSEKITLSVSTNKKTVGEALAELKVIAGEEGPYGLYIKTVNGITLDFNSDGKYWAFYVGNKYAPKGIDQTEIEPDEIYGLKVE